MISCFVILAFITSAFAAVTVSPVNFIGFREGLYPQTFSGRAWKASSTYVFTFTISDIVKPYPCQICVTNSTKLCCNLGDDSVNFQSDSVPTALYEDKVSIFSGNAAVGDVTNLYQYVTYWPVSAPANVSTVIYVNVTVDPSSQSSYYKFDRTGGTQYTCIWYIDPTSPLNWTNYASSYSTFTPTTDFYGSCKSPVLGSIFVNPTSVGKTPRQNTVVPVKSSFYVAGTDGFTSQLVVVCSVCDQATLTEFDFTSESFNQLSTPANGYITDQVTPTQVNQFGQTVFTIKGSGFQTTVGNKSYSYTALVGDPVAEQDNSLGSRVPQPCTIASPTTLRCQGPTAFTRRIEEAFVQQLIIYGVRGDDTDSQYRLAKFNITYFSAFVDRVAPTDENDNILVGPGSSVYFSTNSIYVPANYTCIITQDYQSVLYVAAPCVASGNATLKCTMPNSVPALSDGQSVEVYLVVYNNGDKEDIGVDNNQLTVGVWTNAVISSTTGGSNLNTGSTVSASGTTKSATTAASGTTRSASGSTTTAASGTTSSGSNNSTTSGTTKSASGNTVASASINTLSSTTSEFSNNGSAVFASLSLLLSALCIILC